MKFSDDDMSALVEPEQLVLISYVLPARLVPGFQREAASLLERLHRASTPVEFDPSAWDSAEFRPPFNSNHRGDESAWDFPPITVQDRKALCWVVDNWTDVGRTLVAGLFNAPPSGIHTFDLAEAVGFDGGLPSAFRAIAGRLRAIERAPFWTGHPDTVRHERGQLLSLDRGADVVREVFAARYPQLLTSNGGER
jgi:hypothetical protein